MKMAFLAFVVIVFWLYWKFLKAFIGPMVKAIDIRLITALQRHTGMKPDMAKAVIRLIYLGLIMLVVLVSVNG